MRDCYTGSEILHIGSHVHEAEFKMNGAVKEVKKCTPFLKNLCLILLQCKLIVDILELQCLGIIVASYTANTVLKHSVEGNRLLRRSGNTVIFLCSLDDFTDFLLLRSG